MGLHTKKISYPNIDTLEMLDRTGLPIAVRHFGLIVDIFSDAEPGSIKGKFLRER